MSRRRARRPRPMPEHGLPVERAARVRDRASPVSTPSRPTSTTPSGSSRLVDAALAGGAALVQYRNKSATPTLRARAGDATRGVLRGARAAAHRQRSRSTSRSRSTAPGCTSAPTTTPTATALAGAARRASDRTASSACRAIATSTARATPWPRAPTTSRSAACSRRHEAAAPPAALRPVPRARARLGVRAGRHRRHHARQRRGADRRRRRRRGRHRRPVRRPPTSRPSTARARAFAARFDAAAPLHRPLEPSPRDRIPQRRSCSPARSSTTPGGVNSPVRAFRQVGGVPRFVEARRRAVLLGRGRQALHRLHRQLGAGDPRPCASGGGRGPSRTRRRAACRSARRPKARSRWPRLLCRLVPSIEQRAPRLVGHRGGDERDPPRARRDRPAEDDQVRRLLPRPRRQPARQGRLRAC